MNRLARAALVVAALTALAVPAAAAADPVVPDTESIKLTTKKKNAGPHPTLAWPTADDAETYLVVVQTRKGRPYWTWQGSDTEVRFGGGAPDAPDDSEGATLTRKMVWFVIALDADGTPVASSAKRRIAP